MSGRHQLHNEYGEQLQRACGSPVDGTDQDINFNGEILMHRRTEMGGVRVEPNTGGGFGN